MISVLISVLPELLEEIANQVADEDLLPKAILGFPLTRDELIEFGGPGRVMDNFLVRGGDDPVTLSTLAPHIPAECAIAKAVTRLDEKFVRRVARIWEVDDPIISTQGHALSMRLGWRWGVENIHQRAGSRIPEDNLLLQEYYIKSGQWDKIDWSLTSWLDANILVLLPADKRLLLAKRKRLLLDIGKCPREQLDRLIEELEGGYTDKWDIMEGLIGYASPERVVDFTRLAELEELSVKREFLSKRYIDGLYAMGTLSIDELDAYEMTMDPDENTLGYINDNVSAFRDEIFLYVLDQYGPSWNRSGCELQPEDYSEEALLNKITRWLKSGEMEGVMNNNETSMMGHREWDEISFPHPKNFIGDQKGTNAILLAWCLCGCPDS